MKAAKSLYRQCSEAIERLIAKPPKQHGGVFTEIDVETNAAKQAKGEWKNADYKQALHDANAVCGTNYRHRKLCRYGPIVLADGTKDYARIAGKIVYADAVSGPDHWETPNGRFPKLMVEDDDFGHQGRRTGTDRNDAEPWDKQPSPEPRHIPKRRASTVRNSKSDKELREAVANLTERVEELEAGQSRQKKVLQQMATA